MKLKSLISLGLIGWAYGQQDNMKISMMDRQSLHDYSLAKCSDGSPAAYYIDKVSNKKYFTIFTVSSRNHNIKLYTYLQETSNSEERVMIYFDNSVDSFGNTIDTCTSVDECVAICDEHPDACTAPVDATRLLQDGLWSREKENNPFANYFKVS